MNADPAAAGSGAGRRAAVDEGAAGRPGASPDREASAQETPARRIADRVLSCPDVADLSRGPFGAVATYLPGGLVPGVAVRDEVVEVHVVARYGRPLPEIADLVRDAIGDLAAGRPVDVTIADLAPSEPQGTPSDPEGRAGVWTEERAGAERPERDEGRRRV